MECSSSLSGRLIRKVVAWGSIFGWPWPTHLGDDLVRVGARLALTELLFMV